MGAFTKKVSFHTFYFYMKEICIFMNESILAGIKTLQLEIRDY